MNNDELRKMGIENWQEIKCNFKKPSVLLGNGFSIGVWEAMHYNSIFQEFLRNAKVQEFASALRAFQTSNFEEILNFLGYAVKVAEAFNHSPLVYIQAEEALKTGLASTINRIQPYLSEIPSALLKSLSNQLSTDFGNIFTLNYDLILYYIRMQDKDESPDDKFGKNNGTLIFNSALKRRSYFIYYLHGSLFIYRQGYSAEKLQSNGDMLKDRLTSNIERGYLPLFISEGNSESKLTAIKNNEYLKHCYSSLALDNSCLVIFGTQLGRMDEHIVKAICEQPRGLIFAIYTAYKTLEEIQLEMRSIEKKFIGQCESLTFVDSSTVFSFDV